jgi:RimJ/RimL family protein N-acetyltransferase
MKKRPEFDSLFHRVVHQKGTEREFELVRGDMLQFKQNQINRIVEICNEPSIFEQIIIEKPVSVSFKYKDALNLAKWARDGWKAGSHFLFFLLEKTGVPTGVVEIKSANTDRAEIGYWNSGKNPGLMTRALGIICKSAAEAGYHRLFAVADSKNHASIKVLESNGFQLVSSRRSSLRNLEEYEIQLSQF